MFFDRTNDMHTDWASYHNLIPPEALDYAQWIDTIVFQLNRGQFTQPRPYLVSLLQMYHTKLFAIARDFWETHSVY